MKKILFALLLFVTVGVMSCGANGVAPAGTTGTTPGTGTGTTTNGGTVSGSGV